MRESGVGEQGQIPDLLYDWCIEEEHAKDLIAKHREHQKVGLPLNTSDSNQKILKNTEGQGGHKCSFSKVHFLLTHVTKIRWSHTFFENKGFVEGQ